MESGKIKPPKSKKNNALNVKKSGEKRRKFRPRIIIIKAKLAWKDQLMGKVKVKIIKKITWDERRGPANLSQKGKLFGNKWV